MVVMARRHRRHDHRRRAAAQGAQIPNVHRSSAPIRSARSSAAAPRSSTYKVEGIGYDFIPDVLDRSLVDEWVKTTDQPSFLLARRLIREEGLLVGGSSGSAMYAALQAAPRLKAGQNCVVVLCPTASATT